MVIYKANIQLRLLFLIGLVAFALYYLNTKFNLVEIVSNDSIQERNQINKQQELRYSTRRIKVIKHNGNVYYINATISDTDRKRELGLSNIQFLESNDGMLFTYDSDQKNGYWMKNMNFSIDIAFVDSKGQIVKIFNSLPICKSDPCTVYSPQTPYHYVVETNSGWFISKGISEKDKIDTNEE